MTEPDHRIGESLRRFAADLDDRAETITVEDVRSRRAAGRTAGDRRRRLLVGAAAGFVAVAGASAWVLAAAGDEQTTVVGPGPAGPPASTSPATPTTESFDVESTYAGWYDWDPLPDEGVAVLDPDGTLTLVDLAGATLAGGPFGGDLAGPELWMQPGMIQPASTGMAEVPSGCTSATVRGGLRVARCGDPDAPRSLAVVDSAGDSTTIAVDAPSRPTGPDPVPGHWRRAMPSPDGRHVLAQWSGECEVPETVVIAVASGEVDGVAPPVDHGAPSSTALGWTADGRAIVELSRSPCGTTAAEPGVHLLDPATGALERLLPPPPQGAQVFHWTKRAYGNDAEWLVRDAIDALGLEGCCGEPSHGGPGVASGAVFEGQEIGITGVPDDVPPGQADVGEPQRLPFLHGEATVSPISGGGAYPGDRLVSFRCGGFTWRLSWWADGPAEVDSMLLLGESLVPYLGCTLAEPPA